MRNCCVEGCTNKHKGHGFCENHLRRYKKYGDPLAGPHRDGITGTHKREHNSWHLMRCRCLCSTALGYNRYGGRGIRICERWLDQDNGFRHFLEDMGERPDGYTLDRIDVNGDYCQENCRWASHKTQNRNRRNNAIITYKGETHTLKEWSEKLNLNYGMLVMRYCRYKWTGDKLFSKPRKYDKIKT